MFIETFVKRPILSSVCSIIILLAGLICIAVLPVEYYPQLAPTQITVMANYTGADATTVESTVTTPLEQAINGARGMKYMTSSSGNDGTSTINVIFENSRNQDDALLDVETRVKQIEPTLPAEVKATGVTIQKNSTAMVLMYTIRSKNNEYDTKFLSNYADRYIKDYIQRVDGVANVIIYGEQKYAIWYRLSRREDDFCIECSFDGIYFSQMRICHMQEAKDEINFGIYAASPENSLNPLLQICI